MDRSVRSSETVDLYWISFLACLLKCTLHFQSFLSPCVLMLSSFGMIDCWPVANALWTRSTVNEEDTLMSERQVASAEQGGEIHDND